MHNVITIGYIVTNDDGRLLDLICCSKPHRHVNIFLLQLSAISTRAVRNFCQAWPWPKKFTEC